jgi:hypothetical protein
MTGTSAPPSQEHAETPVLRLTSSSASPLRDASPIPLSTRRSRRIILSAVAELDSHVVEVVRRLSAAVGEGLVGVYLHGSAAMGAFVPSRSDVDVLAVTRGAIVTTEKLAVADALSESSLPCPGVGLEMSIVTLDATRTPSERPASNFT